MAAQHFSDLEELLEQPETTGPAVSGGVAGGAVRRAWRAVVLLGGVALVAGTAWSVRGTTGVKHAGRGTVGLEEEVQCFETGMFYADPIKMDGTERTVEFSAEACQQRCQVTLYCEHFTFWPDGGCLLTGEISYPKAVPARYAATVSGPKYCGDVPESVANANKPNNDDDDADASGLVAPDSGSSSLVAGGSSGLVAADSGSSGLIAPDSGSSGLVVPAVPALPEIKAPELPTLPPVPPPPVLPGINGTSCSVYPACVAVGLTDGECCPNADQVKLGCCNGFPKQVEEVKVASGTECQLFPNCVALNISEGACCPTADGVQLGCCSSI